MKIKPPFESDSFEKSLISTVLRDAPIDQSGRYSLDAQTAAALILGVYYGGHGSGVQRVVMEVYTRQKSKLRGLEGDSWCLITEDEWHEIADEYGAILPKREK